MPRKKSQSSGNKPLPANQQKGKKYALVVMRKRISQKSSSK